MDENTPQFPSYPQPGIPVAHPKQGAPLFKLRNFLLKPKPKMNLPKVRRTAKKKNQVNFL